MDPTTKKEIDFFADLLVEALEEAGGDGRLSKTLNAHDLAMVILTTKLRYKKALAPLDNSIEAIAVIEAARASHGGHDFEHDPGGYSQRVANLHNALKAYDEKYPPADA